MKNVSQNLNASNNSSKLNMRIKVFILINSRNNILFLQIIFRINFVTHFSSIFEIFISRDKIIFCINSRYLISCKHSFVVIQRLRLRFDYHQCNHNFIHHNVHFVTTISNYRCRFIVSIVVRYFRNFIVCHRNKFIFFIVHCKKQSKNEMK